MAKGQTFPSEKKVFEDPASGALLTQLTDHKAHSHHPYFTNPGWYSAGKKLLFGSDRGNATNLYSIELETGEITQLTDLTPLPLPNEVEFLKVCVNPAKEEAYYFYGREVHALDLESLDDRVIGEFHEGFSNSMMNCTADGKWICAGEYEDLSDRIRTDFLRGYVGFAETHDAFPLSRILRIAVDGTKTETVWEEKYWIGHVNTSPALPGILTYCHEGPWDKVDNRIWGLDMETGKTWMIRPRTENEVVGHEYWHADGITVGYHGHGKDGKIFGKITYDNTDPFETAFPFETGHIHSNDFNIIVGDGGSQVRLWKWNGESFDGPRALCTHRSSFHTQQLHVHPRFNKEGTQVLFTSDMSGYGNVYLAEVADFETLPEINE